MRKHNGGHKWVKYNNIPPLNITSPRCLAGVRASPGERHEGEEQRCEERRRDGTGGAAAAEGGRSGEHGEF